MVREIIKDEAFLAQKCENATIEDVSVAQDLLDTLEAKKKECVGLAANMIGEAKKIIVFMNNGSPNVMFNPKITKAEGKYRVEESCLSLDDKHITYRFQNITVKFKDMNFKTQIRSYSGFTAEIVQHEIDHCSGIVI